MSFVKYGVYTVCAGHFDTDPIGSIKRLFRYSPLKNIKNLNCPIKIKAIR